jgi:murein DD-endopeptidase MepM/ murein hydrolase activator NlpD
MPTRLTIGVLIAIVLLSFGTDVFSASRVDELKSKIEERNNELQSLEKEIEEYTEQINTIAGEKRTLQSTIKELELTERKLNTDIKVTEGSIANTNLTLEKLEIEITTKEEEIDRAEGGLEKSIRTIQELDSQTFIESFLAEETLSSLWEKIDLLKQFQVGLKSNLDNLKSLKDVYESRRGEQRQEKSNLVSLKDQLTGQHRVVASNKREKDTLLDIKENDEVAYQRLLQEKQRLYEEFQRELHDFEAQLQIELDPNAVPDAGDLFSWPLDSVIITQNFGGTEFAARNPHVYGRPFHNGTDFGTPTGSRIYAPLGGIVAGSGDTDVFPSCLSYGKWILINHQNGLSTLYAHLSHINVSREQTITRGQVIGLSGNTGYSTGPHLHFTVYQSEGVRIVRLGDVKTKTNCAQAEIPVAPLDAYLDPLQYLPEL